MDDLLTNPALCFLAFLVSTIGFAVALRRGHYYTWPWGVIKKGDSLFPVGLFVCAMTGLGALLFAIRALF